MRGTAEPEDSSDLAHDCAPLRTESNHLSARNVPAPGAGQRTRRDAIEGPDFVEAAAHGRAKDLSKGTPRRASPVSNSSRVCLSFGRGSDGLMALQTRFSLFGQEGQGIAEAEIDHRGHQIDLEGPEGPLDCLLSGAGKFEDADNGGQRGILY